MPLQTKKSVTERKPRGKRCVVVCEPLECLEEKCPEDLHVVPDELPVVPDELPVVPDELPVVPEESLELTPEEFICESEECLEELPLKMLKEKPLRNDAGCYLNPKTNRYVKEGTANFKKLVKDKVIVLEVV